MRGVVSILQWEEETARNNNETSNVSLVELKNLNKLNTLCMCIEIVKADVILKDLFTERLKRYEIWVGGRETFSESIISSRMLHLKKLPESSFLYDHSGLGKLMTKCEDLCISKE
ncbi:hypothetical protein PanWU01x14_245940 [Parasponia andersonii]|uniref:Uncharacterized protein n=1 Tax=Parasponia andersonii TaxID=3476 RepID=A0A2P5BEK5_PARAD|nr:hypothetical protein PanWU01x14_245940 [Parasponia andersonii]